MQDLGTAKATTFSLGITSNQQAEHTWKLKEENAKPNYLE